MRDMKTIVTSVLITFGVTLFLIFIYTSFSNGDFELKSVFGNRLPVPPTAAELEAHPSPAPDDAQEAQQPPEYYFKQAQEAYAGMHYGAALHLTEKAQAIMISKRSEQYRLAFPQPTQDWQIDETEERNAIARERGVPNTGMHLNFAPLVTRTYQGYGHTLKVSINSNMSQQVLRMMESNAAGGATFGRNSNREPVMIKGNQAVYTEYNPPASSMPSPPPDTTLNPMSTYMANRMSARVGNQKPSHSLQVYVGSDLVTFQSATLPKDSMIQFANAFDYDRLKNQQ